MELTLFDHALALLLVALLPVHGIRNYKRLTERLRHGWNGARSREYRRVIAMEWGIVALLAALWIWRERGTELLGLVAEPSWRFWLGLGLTVVAVVFALLQLRTVRRSAEARVEVRQKLGSLVAIVPRTAQEMRWFIAVSVTAGVCEELLFRGFLFAYLEGFVATPWALLISSAMFGLGHAYQGPIGILKTGAVGLVLGGLYWLTGSLLAPMILHAMIDWNSGAIALAASQNDGDIDDSEAGEFTFEHRPEEIRPAPDAAVESSIQG